MPVLPSLMNFVSQSWEFMGSPSFFYFSLSLLSSILSPQRSPSMCPRYTVCDRGIASATLCAATVRPTTRAHRPTSPGTSTRHRYVSDSTAIACRGNKFQLLMSQHCGSLVCCEKGENALLLKSKVLRPTDQHNGSIITLRCSNHVHIESI